MSKLKYSLRKADIFIEPKLYAKRENLPFVKAVNGSIRSAWSVRPFREDYEANCKLGTYYAILFLAHNQHVDQNPNVDRMSLSWVLRDMPKIPRHDERQEDSSYDYGVEVGFLEIVEQYLRLRPYGIPADGIPMQINLLMTGDRMRDLRNPFYTAEQCAAKRKAAAERESRDLAKPANLRKLSERIKKMRTVKQGLALSKLIEKLPEPHKERLESEWHEKAMFVSASMLFKTPLFNDRKKPSGKKKGAQS